MEKIPPAENVELKYLSSTTPHKIEFSAPRSRFKLVFIVVLSVTVAALCVGIVIGLLHLREETASKKGKANISEVSASYEPTQVAQETPSMIVTEATHSLELSSEIPQPSQTHVSVIQSASKVDGQWTRWSTWSNCPVTCGGGNQTRTRLCSNPEPKFGGKDCAGRSWNINKCAEWKCPDCARVCTRGTLNTPICDACICDTHVLYGKVTDRRGVPQPNTSIALASTPYNILGTTNLTGQFVIAGICAQGETIRVKKQGYVPEDVNTTMITADTSTTSSSLTLIDPPIFVLSPVNQIRTVGQRVVFCCGGKGVPLPRVEWFKDGDIIKEAEGSNETLVIENVNYEDTGDYKCRLVTEYNSIFSSPAHLTVYSPRNDTCDSSPIPFYIPIPPGCTSDNMTSNNTLDVKTCPQIPCILNNTLHPDSLTCDGDLRMCCGVKEEEELNLTCLEGRITMKLYRVKSCGCQKCSPLVTIVEGTVKGRVSGKPLKYGDIYIGQEKIGETDYDGTFSIKVNSSTEKLVLTFKDPWYKNFAERTKHVSFTRGETVQHLILVEALPEAIEFDSQTEAVLEVGNSSSEGTSFAHIELQPGSLITKSGEIYKGKALARINVIDPRNRSNFENVPGDFSFVDEEGDERSLLSYGVFSVNFEDPSGKELETVKPMNVYLDPDELDIGVDKNGSFPVKLWRLDEVNGQWVLESDLQPQQPAESRRRKKRALEVLLEGSVMSYTKWNLDYITYGDQICFVKVRVFDENESEITRAKVYLVGERISGQSYGYEEELTTAGVGACIEVFCDNLGYIKALDQVETQVEGIDHSDEFPHLTFSLESKWTMKFKAVKPQGVANGPVFRYDQLSTCKDPNQVTSYFKFQKKKRASFTYLVAVHDRPYAARLTWNPKRNQKCYIRVEVTRKSAEMIAQSFKKKTMESFGIYVAKHENSETGGILCLEYRCSGKTFDESGEEEEGGEQKTEVHVLISKVSCRIKSVDTTFQVDVKGTQPSSTRYQFDAPITGHANGKNNGLFRDKPSLALTECKDTSQYVSAISFCCH